MKSTRLVAIIFAIAIFGCRKINTELSPLQVNTLQSNIEIFLQQRMTEMNTTRKEKVLNLLGKMQFASVKIERFNDDATVITVPLTDVNVHNFLSFMTVKDSPQPHSMATLKPKDKNHITKAFFVVRDGEIIDANIIDVSSNVFSEAKLDEKFIPVIQNKVSDFSGHINVNSIDEIPYNNWYLEGGRVSSSTVLKRGKSGNTGQQVTAMSTCTDWYWVTTYYWSDGSQTQSWSYVGTTCSEEEGFAPQNEGASVPADTLCAQSKRLANNFAFKNAVTDLKNRLTESVENGYGQYGNTFVFKAGTAAGVSATGMPTGLDGFYHNHLSGLEQTFSLVDFNQLFQYLVVPGHINNLSTFTFGVVLNSGQVQLVRISDPIAFMAFGNANLTNGNFANFQSSASSYFANATTYDQRTAALMKAMQGSGLTFYEGNTGDLNSGFQRLDPSADADLNIIRTKCNN
jgi:hypothetical protein